MTAITGAPGHTPINWNHVIKGVVGVVFFTAIIVTMGQAFGVDGLQPPNGECQVAVDVVNPASHTDCTKMIDSVRADAWTGFGLVIVAWMLLFVGNRLLARFPSMRSVMFFVAMLLGGILAAIVFPLIGSLLDSWNMITEVVVRGAISTALLLGYFWCLAFWDTKLLRLLNGIRARMAAPPPTTPATPVGTTGTP